MITDNEHGYCPNCKTDLDGLPIWEYFYLFYSTGDSCSLSDEEVCAEADRVAANYGATRDKGKFSKKIGLYDVLKDRTSAWECGECGHIWERK